jgi:hypothetical protein
MEHTGLYSVWNRRMCTTSWRSNHSSKMVNSSLPQFTALEVTAVNIPARTETLTNGAVYTPSIRPFLAQDLTKLTQYNQQFLFVGDYNNKHRMWHSRLNKRQGSAYGNLMLSNTATKSQVRMLLLISQRTAIFGRTSST